MANSYIEELNNLIPENFKDNDTINSLLEIYYESVNHIPYKDIYNFDRYPYITDNDIHNDKVKKELLEIYLQEVDQYLGTLDSDSEINEKFKELYEKMGLNAEDYEMALDVERVINKEYISASKDFKTKKGTKSGFFFIYDLINRTNVQGFNNENIFRLLEGTADDSTIPYVYRVETSLYKEIYDKSVYPLSHPAGFEYIFARIVMLVLEDNYNFLQKEELTELIFSCYENINGDKVLKRTNALDGTFGEFNKIKTDTDNQGNERVIVDFNKTNTEEPYRRIYRDYDGSITLYSRANKESIAEGEFEGQDWYLDIIDIELLEQNSGILKKYTTTRGFKYDTYQAVTEISFQEYSIIDKPTITVRFRIFGDKPNTWYISELDISDKTLSSDKKLYNRLYFTREEIFENALDYNGRVIQEKDEGCVFNYNTEKTFELAVKDILPEVMQLTSDINVENRIQQDTIPKTEDVFPRCYNFTEDDWIIGQYYYDGSETGSDKYKDPTIGENYEIGLHSDLFINDYQDTSESVPDNYSGECGAAAYEKMNFSLSYTLNTNNPEYLYRTTYEIGGTLNINDEDVQLETNANFNTHDYEIFTNYLDIAENTDIETWDYIVRENGVVLYKKMIEEYTSSIVDYSLNDELGDIEEIENVTMEQQVTSDAEYLYRISSYEIGDVDIGVDFNTHDYEYYIDYLLYKEDTDIETWDYIEPNTGIRRTLQEQAVFKKYVNGVLQEEKSI